MHIHCLFNLVYCKLCFSSQICITDLLGGTYNLIPSLPIDIWNKISPALFRLIESVACRDASSSMITFSNSTSQYWHNRDQHTPVPAFPPRYVTKVHVFRLIVFDLLVLAPVTRNWALHVRVGWWDALHTLRNCAEAIKHAI